jgi:hypothetical protein
MMGDGQAYHIDILGLNHFIEIGVEALDVIPLSELLSEIPLTPAKGNYLDLGAMLKSHDVTFPKISPYNTHTNGASHAFPLALDCSILLDDE